MANLLGFNKSFYSGSPAHTGPADDSDFNANISKSKNMSALAMGLAAATSIAQASALEAQGNYAENAAKANAEDLDRAASETTDLGNKESSEHMEKVRKVVSSQRASLAAQGVAVDSGSASDVQVGTLLDGISDSKVIRNNAIRTALGLKTQAVNMRSQGAMAAIGAKNAANQTLVTGGLQAASMFTKK